LFQIVGCVATRFRYGAESDSERILKIGQHLLKLWTIKYRVVFFMKHGVYRLITAMDRTFSLRDMYRLLQSHCKMINYIVYLTIPCSVREVLSI